MNRPFVNGNREQTNNFTVDGLDVNETIDNRVAYQPSPDALAEISVETNNYAADVGNVGGAAHQQRHQVRRQPVPRQRVRVLPEQRLRRQHLGEQPLAAPPRQERKQHIFGGTLGGPIVKDKLFFFADYQGSRQDAPGSATASVAPEAWRRGDLSSITTPIRDPRTRAALPGQPDPARPDQPDRARDPERHRELPAARTARCPGGSPATTWARPCSRSAPTRATCASTGTPPPNDKLFGRFSFATYQDQRDQQAFPLIFATRNDQPFYNVGVNWTRVLGPVADQRGARRLQPHHRRSPRRSTGPASAPATRRYGIAGGQPIDGLSCMTSAAGACAGLNGLTPSARSRPTRTPWPRRTRSTRS